MVRSPCLELVDPIIVPQPFVDRNFSLRIPRLTPASGAGESKPMHCTVSFCRASMLAKSPSNQCRSSGRPQCRGARSGCIEMVERPSQGYASRRTCLGSALDFHAKVCFTNHEALHYLFVPSLNRSSIIGVSTGRGMRFRSTISPSTTNSM